MSLLRPNELTISPDINGFQILDVVFPQEGFAPGPLIPRLKHFPATRILPIETLCETTANRKSLLMALKMRQSTNPNDDEYLFPES